MCGIRLQGRLWGAESQNRVHLPRKDLGEDPSTIGAHIFVDLRKAFTGRDWFQWDPIDLKIGYFVDLKNVAKDRIEKPLNTMLEILVQCF